MTALKSAGLFTVAIAVLTTFESGVRSYWHTRVSKIGASASAGRRSRKYARAASTDSGNTVRSPCVGSKLGPLKSSATFTPRDSADGKP